MNATRFARYASFAFVLLSLSVAPALRAQEAPKPAPPQHPEKIYSADFDRVWDDVVAVLTEKGLSDHPHGKMSANKESGKITTPTFRYFRISSARPVQEKDYRDTYTILVAKADAAPAADKSTAPKEGEKQGAAEAPKPAPASLAKGVKVQIQRKFEIYDNEKKAWVEGDAQNEGVGITNDALFHALDSKLLGAAKETTPAADAKEATKSQ